jgi:glycosyltransferase involved in cell wall biosynthesis
MKHIALITTSYPDSVPGAEAAGGFVADFALELSRHMRVTVLAASLINSQVTNGNLTECRFAVPKLPLSLLNPLNPTHWGQILSSLRSGQNAVELLAQNDRPDHFLALWALPGGYWADRVEKQYGIKFSVWALGSDVWGLGRIPVVRQVLKRVLTRAERRYADGLELANDVEKICGLDCSFLPSARLLQPAEDSKKGSKKVPDALYNLAFLGRWHRNKGVDMLLDALDLLDDKDWQSISEVRIYGGGPLHERVHEGVDKLIAQGRSVSVGGYLDSAAAAKLIEWADYLLLPSRVDSIPVIFSDAVQLHTPIIAAPAGDLPRLHAKYNYGVMAGDKTPAAYAEAIQAALNINPTAFDAGLNAARPDFDLAEIVRRFVDEISDDDS